MTLTREMKGAGLVEDPVCGALTYKKFGNTVAIELTAQTQGGALPDHTAADLAELCNRIASDERVRVVVLGFNGRIGNPGLPRQVQCGSLVEPVAQLKQPVIAAIGGDATGLGLELALACDIRIGEKNARFGLPQVREGQMPCHGGTQRLPRLIGCSKAMEMILTGETIDAEEALRCGLIHRVFPPDALMKAALDLAGDMAEQSPLSLSYAKEALNKGLDLTLDQGISAELDLYLLLFSTSDRTEGITAFKEKRKPKFEGA